MWVPVFLLAAALAGATPAPEEGEPDRVVPERVVRRSRWFGTITIEHAAHIARRAACRQCHGPGPAGPITFTPRVAHERCVGCHRDAKAGPVACRECHVKPPPPPLLPDPGA